MIIFIQALFINSIKIFKYLNYQKYTHKIFKNFKKLTQDLKFINASEINYYVKIFNNFITNNFIFTIDNKLN